MGMGNFDAESPQPKKARQEEAVTCLPVTVRMIESSVAARSGDGEIRFHGTEPGMLLLVGVIESLSQQAASIEFVLNDSTGRIRGRYYASEAESKLLGLEAGKYASVAAQVRTAPSLHLTVTAARPVKTADDISYHMVEAAHAALKLQLPAPSTQSAMAATPVPKRQPLSDMDVSPPKSTGAALSEVDPLAQACPPAAIAPAAAKGTLSGIELRKAVLAFLQKEAEGHPEGVALASICARMASARDADVKAVLEQLVEDGDAYNTIDDGHFSSI